MEEPRRRAVIALAVAGHVLAVVALVVLVPDIVRLVLPDAPAVLSTVRRVQVQPRVEGTGGGEMKVAVAAPAEVVAAPVVLSAKPAAGVKKPRVGARAAKVAARGGAGVDVDAGAQSGAGADAGAGAGAGADEGAGAGAGAGSVVPAVVEPVKPAEPSPEDVSAWTAEVAALIARRVQYPSAALDDELEGTTLVTMNVSDDGALSGFVVAKSSGEPVLDAAALRQLAAIGKVAAPPGGRARVVRVPVRFRLDR